MLTRPIKSSFFFSFIPSLTTNADAGVIFDISGNIFFLMTHFLKFFLFVRILVKNGRWRVLFNFNYFHIFDFEYACIYGPGQLFFFLMQVVDFFQILFFRLCWIIILHTLFTLVFFGNQKRYVEISIENLIEYGVASIILLSLFASCYVISVNVSQSSASIYELSRRICTQIMRLKFGELNLCVFLFLRVWQDPVVCGWYVFLFGLVLKDFKQPYCVFQ